MNSRWLSTSRSSRAVISLNVRASRCCSALPSDLGARREVALRDAAGGLVEPAHRPGDLAGDQGAGAEPEHEHEQADRDQAERRAPRGAADGVDALGDAHRPAGCVGALPGIGTAVARIVWSSVSLWRCSCTTRAAQRGGDLRPAAVVDAEPLLARGVGEQAPVRADDDHAAAQPRRGAVDDALELRRAPRVDGRREELGLAARLRLHLAVDAVAQADDQRDLEGDDRQHQHVGERQQQADPEGYENSSGAVKRKPTPRTVCR